MLDLRTAGAVVALAGVGLLVIVRRRREAGIWEAVGFFFTGVGIAMLLEYVATGNRGP